MSQGPEFLSLPEPPPPRAAARDTAIDGALRRFDGIEEPASPPSRERPWTRRPEFQLAVAASVVLLVGIPATVIGLRDQAPSPIREATPAVPAPSQANSADGAVVVEQRVAGRTERNAQPPVPALIDERSVAPSVTERHAQPPAQERPEADVAAAPPPPAPPPPPPPPPAAPLLAQKGVDARAGDVTVTGTRIPRPNLTSPSPVTVLETNSAERDEIASLPKIVQKDRAYFSFFRQLQIAVRTNDRAAVIKLIHFPLRVNYRTGSRVYADGASVRADYDGVFNSNVRQAILRQKTKELAGGDQGMMIGSGQVWFDHICANAAACSPPGPVRITAVNP